MNPTPAASTPKFKSLLFALIFGLSWVIAVYAKSPPPPQPIEKRGPCPSGYTQSGDYCAPLRSAHFAVHKNGPCPSGYTVSGDYCLAMNNAHAVIPKSGPCPSGWTQSANYCMSLAQ